MNKDVNENLFKDFPGPEKTGKFISELRKEAGLTQEQVSKRLFVTRKAVSKWENGNCYPSIEIFPALEKLFDVTFEELLNGERKLNGAPVDDARNINFIVKVFRKRQIKQLIIFITIVLMLCLSIFFFENYNATKIYSVWYEDDEVYIENGMIVITKAKEYFNFGYFKSDIKEIGRSDPVEFVLYVNKDNITYDLLRFTINDSQHFEKTNYNELSEIKINNNFDSLYMKIIYKDSIENKIKEKHCKLNVKLNFQSNDFYNIKKLINKSHFQTSNVLTNIHNSNDITTDDFEKIKLEFLSDFIKSDNITKYTDTPIIIDNQEFKLYYDKNIIVITGDTLEITINTKLRRFRLDDYQNSKNSLNIKITDDTVNIPSNSDHKDLCLKIVEILNNF